MRQLVPGRGDISYHVEISSTTTEAILRGEDLSKVYGAGEARTQALSNCDLTLNSGTVVTVVGPSGSGKSTLLNVLSGLDRPTTGRVVFDGVTLSDLSDREAAYLRASKIGFVLQRSNLIPSLSVCENVAAPLLFCGIRRSVALRRADQLLARVGISHRRDALPGEVSGGEAQRAAVARACAGEPKLIFADEPTGALDQESGRVVMSLLEEMTREVGACAVIVTHDQSIAARGDATLRLLDGRPVS